jgi:protein NRD1
MPQSQFPGFPPQPPPSVPQQYAQAPPPQQPPPQQADPLASLRGILPQNILNDQQKLIDALKLLQDMQKDGIPMDQWGPVIEAFDSQYRAPARQGYDNYGRRSRSPERGGGRRRASPVYGTYEDMTRNQGGDDRGGYGNSNRYRQRSPIQNSPTPMQGNGMAMNGMPMQPKYIAIDNSLPRDNIKVLSRTLFVGGASGSQQEIQELFERFGRVQTCIANREKRHAFVKMTTRKDAISAKEHMERLQSSNDREVMNIARQTKWGVGFGPRECCN